MSIPIREIWMSNLEYELGAIDLFLRRYGCIAIDTEFPGFLRNTPRYTGDSKTYDDLKYNVDMLNPVQLGFTLFNENGAIGCAWQVHFCDFDTNADTNDPSASISLTKRRSGIDFERQRREGINSRVFALKLQNILARHRYRSIKWITFHGLYDLAYTAKIMTGLPLPDTLTGFHSLLGDVFGSITDVKFIARFCAGLNGGELGLERLARVLKVARIGGAHQAGSDSLLTACVYLTMRKIYSVNSELHEGYLYGVGGRVEKKPQLPRILPRPAVVVRCVPCPFAQPPAAVIYPHMFHFSC